MFLLVNMFFSQINDDHCDLLMTQLNIVINIHYVWPFYLYW